MPTEKLSRREREILDLVYALGGSATAEQIREGLSDPPSYSAVRAMLTKLEGKGQIQHRAEGLRYVYSPTATKAAAQKRALGQLTKVFFAGSPIQAAAALLKQENWTDEDLDSLKAEIDRVRNERVRS